MRLWHYKLIPFLPNSQLIAQWRELNSIFRKQDKHILINYIYEYPDDDLELYSLMVRDELLKRGYKIKNYENANNYFGDDFENLITFRYHFIPFKKHHDYNYLVQCFYNLQEKYERGQRDFSKKEYQRLDLFMDKEIFEEMINNEPDITTKSMKYLEEATKEVELHEKILNIIKEHLYFNEVSKNKFHCNNEFVLSEEEKKLFREWLNHE